MNDKEDVPLLMTHEQVAQLMGIKHKRRNIVRYGMQAIISAFLIILHQIYCKIMGFEIWPIVFNILGIVAFAVMLIGVWLVCSQWGNR